MTYHGSLLLCAALSALIIVHIPSETTILDNKGSNLPSARWRQHIGLILTGKCRARATEQCNWRGSWSRSGSDWVLGEPDSMTKNMEHVTLGFFFFCPHFRLFLSSSHLANFTLFPSPLLSHMSSWFSTTPTLAVVPLGAYIQGIHNELFLHSHNPFKYATGRL